MKSSFLVGSSMTLWSMAAMFVPYPISPPATAASASTALVAATPEALDEGAIALTLADLPPGFTEIPPSLREQIVAQFAVLRQEFGQEDLPVTEVFAFFHPAQLQAVGGFTGEFATAADQDRFDRQLEQLQDPETQAQVLEKLRTRLQDLGNVEVQGYTFLDDLEDFGDAATGFTLDLTIQGIPFQIDLMSFRRDRIGAFTALLSRQQATRPPITDLAATLDRRIVEALSPNP